MDRLEGKELCHLCGFKKLSVLEDCCSEYRVLQCSNCGLAFLSPLPEDGFLKTAYSADYYKPWLLQQRRKRIRMWNKRLSFVDGFFPDKGKILDVGCGEGLFLELARKDGWLVTGTELSSFAAEYVKTNLDMPVLEGQLTEMGFRAKEFDCITLWHVLEHTKKPLDLLIEAKRILKDSGILFMAVPNLNCRFYNFFYRIIKCKNPHLFDPSDRELHLFYFTQDSIKTMLEKAGFGKIKILADMADIRAANRLIDNLAWVWSKACGRWMVQALLIHARAGSYH